MIDDKIRIEAEEAERLLNDPALTKLLASIRLGLMDEWADQKNPEERERLWHQLQATNEIEGEMSARIQRLAQAVRKAERK